MGTLPGEETNSQNTKNGEKLNIKLSMLSISKQKFQPIKSCVFKKDLHNILNHRLKPKVTPTRGWRIAWQCNGAGQTTNAFAPVQSAQNKCNVL